MIADKRRFFLGFGLIIGFIILIIVIFLPVFNGGNCLEYMDSLYNSISKGSANYIPELKEKSGAFQGERIDVTLRMNSESRAQQAAGLLEVSGAMVKITGREVSVDGGLGRIFEVCLSDSELMYNNKGQDVSAKYDLEGRHVLYTWYMVFKALDKALSDQGRFKEADMVKLVSEKAVECAYNYYNIEPMHISDSMGIVIFSLLFYVIYTVWYGFSFMYMFEGLGLKLEH